MNKVIALLTLILLHSLPLGATTLVGIVQYRDVEGRIGVRVNHSGRVFKVHAQSPADMAGIRQGDVITSVNGERHHFVGKIHGTPGTTVHLTIKRDGDELAFQVPRVEFQQIQVHELAPLLVQK